MGRLSHAPSALVLGLAICVLGCVPPTGGLASTSPVIQPTVPPSGIVPPTPGEPGTSTEPGPSTQPGPSGATSVPLSTVTPFTGPTWQSLAGFPSSEAFQVTSVAAVGEGFTAVGFQAMPGEGFFGRRQGVVWHTADGRSWQAVVDAAFQFVTPEEVFALGTTTFVLGTYETCGLSSGDECSEPPEAGWGLWRSIDAGAWERLPLPPSMQTGSIDGAIGGNGSLAVYGLSGVSGGSVVWTSADGVAWNETTDLAGMDPVTAMAVGPTGFIAFGDPFSSDSGDELPAAISIDGVHFVRAATPPLTATTIQSVTTGRTGLAAVGDGENEDDFMFTGVALHSADGLTWTLAGAVDGSFTDSALTEIHPISTGYVALGIKPLLDDFGLAAGASWFSADGLSYRSLAPIADKFTELTASAAGPKGLICFTVTEGETDEDTVLSTIAAWFAPIEAMPAQ